VSANLLKDIDKSVPASNAYPELPPDPERYVKLLFLKKVTPVPGSVACEKADVAL
jgi:hypothetical protein